MTDVRQFGIAAVTVVLMAVVLGHAFGIFLDYSNEPTEFADDRAISNGEAQLRGANITDLKVQQSLGDAATFDGGPNSVADGDMTWSVDQSWHVSVWAAVDNSTGTRTLASFDGRLTLVYNGTSDDYAVWYYNDSTGQMWTIDVAATDQQHLTNVQASHDKTTLKIYRNNSVVDSVVTDDANATTAELATENLDGRLDEVRVNDVAENNTIRQRLVDRPTAPTPNATRRARVMMDSYDSRPRSLPVYIAGGSLDYGGSLGTGLVGEATTPGTDYTRTGSTISTQRFGSLDGAPVLFAAWNADISGLLTGLMSTIGSAAGAAIELAAIAIVAAAASVLIKEVDL